MPAGVTPGLSGRRRALGLAIGVFLLFCGHLALNLTEIGQGNAVSIIPIHAELTTQEAADVLKVPVGTVKSRMHSAVLKLHESELLSCNLEQIVPLLRKLPSTRSSTSDSVWLIEEG